MTKVSRVKKQKRQAAYRASNAYVKMLPVCINCGEKGPHFVPPCFGDPGFFSCLKPGQTPEEKDEELKRAMEIHFLAYGAIPRHWPVLFENEQQKEN